MGGLVEKLLADKKSGLITDNTGRRYFRQRKVQFHTIHIDARDLHGSGWLDFETDLTLDWNKDPSHEEIRAFAAKSSQRFLSFWYKVFDVAAARSLSGRDRAIFRRTFFEGSAFGDLGIPDEPTYSSVPPLLHRKILEEYRACKPFRPRYRIYYLSDYLEGLTDDMSVVLRPYRRLWRRLDARNRVIERIDNVHSGIEAALFAAVDEAGQTGPGPAAWAAEFLEFCALSALDAAHEARTHLKIADEHTRTLVFKRKAGALSSLSADELERIFAEPMFAIPRSAQTLFGLLRLPGRCHQIARRAAAFCTTAHRLRLRIARHERLHSNASVNEALALRLRDTNRRLDSAVALLGKITGIDAADSLCAKYASIIRLLRALDARIEELYHSRPNDLPGAVDPAVTVDPRFPEAESLTLPDTIQLGDPFAEPAVVQAAKHVVMKRLRPIRMTASYYSLNPAHRHGCMTLNPVMKLWKDRPHTGTKSLPRLCGLEINTKETAECLLRLVLCADPGLAKRQVLRGRIAALQYRNESLETLKLFLVPGSCAPVREINRLDFPEFRGKVIGESRTPSELGIPRDEDAVLTGAWYRKNSHTLYYPVGGDNGRLLHTIWISGRSSGPPAFFFALGQFVYDCLADKLTYTRSEGQTFRECVEDYYTVEDRIRKNRDERTGRRRLDNTRPGIRFMFAVSYSRIIMEALTGSAQVQFRHPPTESWMHNHLGLPILAKTDRARFRSIRTEARSIVSSYD